MFTGAVRSRDAVAMPGAQHLTEQRLRHLSERTGGTNVRPIQIQGVHGASAEVGQLLHGFAKELSTVQHTVGQPVNRPGE